MKTYPFQSLSINIISFIILSLAFQSSFAQSNSNISIYAEGSIYPNSTLYTSDNLKTLKIAGFTSLICSALHILPTGDLIYNTSQIISNGEYIGHPTWPATFTDILTPPSTFTNISLSVGSNGTSDFESIQELIQSGGIGPDSILYQNFAALKVAIPQISVINIDSEDFLDNDTIVQFSIMLGSLGYNVSFLVYSEQDFWIGVLEQINEQVPNIVTQIYLQCYGNGTDNDPIEWKGAFEAQGIMIPVSPGLSSLEGDGIDYRKVQDRWTEWKDGGILNGFLWSFDDMMVDGQSAMAYVRAIKAGLGLNYV